MKKKLLVLNGSFNKIIESNELKNTPTNLEIIKINDKLLANPRHIKKLIGNSINYVYFGTIDNSFQRFKFFILLYILIFSRGKGELIDEMGNKIKFNLIHFLLLQFPFFIIEILISFIVVLLSYPIYYFYFLRWAKR